MYDSENIINKFLLTGGKFVPEMHLSHPGFVHSACRPFTKTKQEYKIPKKQETLDKVCFQHYMEYRYFRDLPRRTVTDKDKSFEIASNPKNDGYQRGLSSMVYNFLIERLDRKEQEALRIKNWPVN